MLKHERTKAFVPLLVVLGLVQASLIAPSDAFAADPEIDAQVRVREAVLINHDFDSDAKDRDNFATMRTRLGLGFEAGDHTSAYIQLQDTRALGEPASTLTSLEQVDLHQGYVHVHDVFSTSLSFKVGRQEMAYGAHRQVGTVGWSDVGRSFDGIRILHDIEDFGWLHLWAMKTNETGGVSTIQSGAGITSDPDVETAFFGSYLHYDASEEASIELYLLDSYRDEGDIGVGADLTDAIGNLFTAGTRVVWDSEDYSTKLYAEGAYQFGSAPDFVDTGTSTVVSGPDYAAYAATAGVSYSLPTDVTSWLAFEFNLASGDDDPTDDEIKTYTQLFPTGHAVLGYMDFIGWRNMRGYQFTAGVKPNPEWKFWATFHVFQVAEPEDAWYRASGAATTMGGSVLAGSSDYDSALGNEIDVVASFSPEESLAFLAKFGMWMPGDWQEQAMGGGVATPADLDPAFTVYVQTTASF